MPHARLNDCKSWFVPVQKPMFIRILPNGPTLWCFSPNRRSVEWKARYRLTYLPSAFSLSLSLFPRVHWFALLKHLLEYKNSSNRPSLDSEWLCIETCCCRCLQSSTRVEEEEVTSTIIIS